MGMPIPFKSFTIDRTQITDIEKWIGDGNNLGEVEIRNFLGKIRVDVQNEADENRLRSFCQRPRD
ncbi:MULTISPECIES: hypothetical protein [unclassified Novosphingobium]|uniref:hypothetical protein n=1 Tax=unclassified Novosphingobium TaxID=2644732 RepID=UPI000AD72440|nr:MULTISPECIES: hypothetical protein [unclassified Novosphingobium]MBN9146027.1 hypothetical protein [Novosphingobium sp.]MDR6709432.1 hypothetical protein [Novosphingobium sp. 1748]